MRIFSMIIAFAVATSCASPAFAAPSASDVLNANKAASGGSAWDRTGALALDYAYSGQGLTGTTRTTFDLDGKGVADSYAIGPTAGANGFDGANAWEKEQSGIVSDQKGGDALQLAFNEAYRDGNLWWRAGQSGAEIAADGDKTDQGKAFHVLTVKPKSGKAFDAWFDAKTRFLARIVEVQGSQTITTFYSDYSPVEGMQIARTQIIDDGTGAANRQTQRLTSARLLPVQPVSTYAAPKTAVNDASLAGGVSEATVPFQLINNHIYADVSVNGAKPELFIFDTGGHSILSPALTKALQIKAEGAQTVTGGGSGFAQSGVTRVASLAIGAAMIRDQPVSVFDIAPPAIEGVDAQGMIGYEFFARFVTRFDYGARTITFIDKNRFNPKSAGAAVPFVLYNQLPQVEGSYDGIPGHFCIDTGARMALLLTGPFVAQNNLRARATNGIEAMTGWGVGGASRAFVMHGGTLEIGDVTVAHPLTMLSTDKGGSAAAEAFPNNIGAGVLRRFAVTLDYDHYTMYLKPIGKQDPDIDAFDRSGLWINGDKGGFKIVDVTKGAPADMAGLKAGDVIVSVDGKPASAIHLYDLRQRLRDDAAGAVVRFSIKRGVENEDISVTLRDLI